MKSISAIVLHRTVSSTASSAVNTTKNNKGMTGFHIIIDKDGTVTQVNNFENRANHVGKK
nr:N-acetylmuramoyl-L-alanine amidase [Aureivirga marina]